MRLGIKTCSLLLWTLVLSVGCGGAVEPSSEAETLEFAELGQELTDPCVNATPDHVWEQFYFPGGQSPTIYSNPNCSKRWVYEALDPVPTNTAVQMSFAFMWSDMWPRNEVQCVNAQLAAKVMSRVGNGPYQLALVTNAKARWNAEDSFCEYPTLSVENKGPDWFVRRGYFNVDGDLESRSETPLISSFHGKQVKIGANATSPSGTTQSVLGFVFGIVLAD